MQFKKRSDPIRSDDLYYDLFEGGYIVPSNLLKNLDDYRKVENAINIIRRFLDEAIEKGSIHVY